MTMNAAMPDYGWDWSTFIGTPSALRWTRRDIASLDQIIGMTKGRTAAVQAGGNLGLYPRRLAEVYDTVYSFEPAADLFAIMQLNAPAQNIVRFQAALGCQRSLVGTSRVRRDGKPDNHEGITHIAGEGCIPTLQVDDLGLPVCDLLAIDVEGWELYALQGAAQTLARCRPVVSVEINKSLGFVGIEPEDVRAYLRGHDYRFVVRLQSDEVFVPAEWGRQ